MRVWTPGSTISAGAAELRIWFDALNAGAVYSPDGVTIQFDSGTIWGRDIGLPPQLIHAPGARSPGYAPLFRPTFSPAHIARRGFQAITVTLMDCTP
jgi:hypothetical protein